MQKVSEELAAELKSLYQEKKWIKAEEESYKLFKKFSELTDNFNSGKASLLFTPELEMAKDWIENDNHNVNWAKKYNFNYQNKRTNLFLLNSARAPLTGARRASLRVCVRPKILAATPTTPQA